VPNPDLVDRPIEYADKPFSLTHRGRKTEEWESAHLNDTNGYSAGNPRDYLRTVRDSGTGTHPVPVLEPRQAPEFEMPTKEKGEDKPDIATPNSLVGLRRIEERDATLFRRGGIGPVRTRCTIPSEENVGPIRYRAGTMWCTVENGGVVMSDRSANVLGHLIRGITAEAAGEPDGALVARFLAARDERAFEALVFRYGSMVYRVCLRNAGSEAAAEDAYQATFLVLARDLSAVRDRQSLASWLHGVARRVALKARAGAEARRVRERSASRAEAVPPSDPARAEALTALDEELARLPDRYRLPLVLCYLDGRTRDEAARLLGWSLGTLKRRLAEGRDALSARLVRRGVGPAALSAVLLSECVAGAASTPRLLASIVSTASPQAAPLAAGVPGHILSLANGVSNMFLTKTKLAIAALVLTAAVGLPAGLLLSAAQPPRTEPPPPRAEKAAAVPLDPKKKLAQFEGTWTFLSQTDAWPNPSGKGPDETGQGSERKWVIQGNEITWTDLDGREVKASFTIDADTVPRQIDLTFLSGPHKGEKCPGLYERSGQGGTGLRLCLADPGSKSGRPKDISYATDEGRSLIVLSPFEKKK
jgi:RNA polymerase sigma factor (sigma-70 family)